MIYCPNLRSREISYTQSQEGILCIVYNGIICPYYLHTLFFYASCGITTHLFQLVVHGSQRYINSLIRKFTRNSVAENLYYFCPVIWRCVVVNLWRIAELALNCTKLLLTPINHHSVFFCFVGLTILYYFDKVLINLYFLFSYISSLK